MDESDQPRSVRQRIRDQLVALGAELADNEDDLSGPVGFGAPPLTPLGDHVVALRLLSRGTGAGFQVRPTGEAPEVGIASRLISIAGLDDVQVRAPTQPMVGGRDWSFEGPIPPTVELSSERRSVFVRPRVWRGTIDGSMIVDAVNAVAGARALGCGLDSGDWLYFRSNDAIDSYVSSLLDHAVEPVVEHALEVLDLYRPHGFFRDLDHLQPEAAAGELGRRLMGRFGLMYRCDSPRTSRPVLELSMLATDEQRVWWVSDAEHAAQPAMALLDTVLSWAKVSAGALAVSAAHVSEDGSNRLLDLRAVVNGVLVSASIESHDWIPTAAVQRAINDVISPALEVVAATTGSQDTFAMVASPGLRDLLHDRGLAMRPDFDWRHPVG